MTQRTVVLHTALTALVAGARLQAAAAQAQPIPILERGLRPGDLAIGPAANSQQDHAVARGGDQYLAVWSDYRGQAVGGDLELSADVEDGAAPRDQDLGFPEFVDDLFVAESFFKC